MCSAEGNMVDSMPRTFNFSLQLSQQTQNSWIQEQPLIFKQVVATSVHGKESVKNLLSSSRQLFVLEHNY